MPKAIENLSGPDAIAFGNAIAPYVAAAVYGGALLPSVWTRLPAIYALRLRGSGTVAIELKDADGAIFAFPETFNPTGPSKVAFPYFGDRAVYARATLTGTASAEVF